MQAQPAFAHFACCEFEIEKSSENIIMEANTAKKKELENNTESPQISVQNSETNNLVKPQQSTLSKSALKKLRRRQEWYRVYFFISKYQ